MRDNKLVWRNSYFNSKLWFSFFFTGDNSYKTAVMGSQRGSNAGRQDTNDFENAIPATDTPDGRSNRMTSSSTSGYLAEKDQNLQLPSEYNHTSSASSMANGYNHTRYNREYPNGGRNFSSYKSRYHQHQFSSNVANRDTNSIHSNFSASHQKNCGASSSTDTSSTTSSGYRNCENGWRPPRHNRQYSNYYGYNKENSGYASTNHVSGNGKLELKILVGQISISPHDLFKDEYTRITTPRQDVLFKKGYLSRPKRLEDGYLGPPLISQQQPLANGEVSGEEEVVPIIPPNDDDSAVIPNAEDNSPLYFCPGFVDHNGYFHANRKPQMFKFYYYSGAYF